jgi:hypothetical protein
MSKVKAKVPRLNEDPPIKATSPLSTTTDKGRIEHLLIYKFPLPSPPA